jgi:uridine phosphorylase
VHEGSWEGKSITVAGPVLGAPYAVMVTEKLIALGAQAVLALGWCGSLQEEIKVGAIIVPSRAVSGDGTSPHYLAAGVEPAPHPEFRRLLQTRLKAADISPCLGPVWTTDAFYRETPEQVRHYRNLGVYGVDLEMAALFALGQYRQVAVAGLLVVSDELAGLTWQPGFKTQVFRQARDAAARVALAAAGAWQVPGSEFKVPG